MRGRLLAAASITAVIAMATAASASAAALYVDDSGVDTGVCTAPSSPCDTIGYAISQAGASDVIHLGGGTYNETVVLANAVSLIEDSTFSAAASGPAVLDNPMPAITLQGTGTVDGLTITSAQNPVRVEASGTLSNNRFEFPNAPTGFHGGAVTVSAFVPVSPTITGNTFVDPNPADSQNALVVNTPGGGSPVISDNSFSGFNSAIQAFGPTLITPTISGNEITGTHGAIAGISVAGPVVPTLVANNIHSPGTGTPQGMNVSSAGATLERNRVIGHDKGLVVPNPTDIVTLSSDLIVKSVTRGIDISGGGTTVDAENITVIDNVAAQGDIEVGTGAGLELDSSIVGGGGGANGVNGIDVEGSGAGCIISDSRGTGDTGVSSNCDTGFVSTADPMFVNRGANDYHLQAGSPMIDMGKLAAPAPGTLDMDGDDRALAVAAQCTTPPAGRRDIGADEFVTTCPPPPTPPTTNTPTTPTTKKCKKGQKLKKGKCVKKKRKKKKK